MSELFKALQKLEEQNVHEVPQPFSASSGNKNKRSKNAPPFLKSALLCVLLLGLTIVCLGGIWFATNKFVSSPTISKNDDRKKEQDIPVVAPVSETPDNTILPTKPLLPAPEQIVAQKSILPTEKASLLKKGKRKQHDIQNEHSAAVTPHTINPEVQAQQASIEQFIQNSTSEAEKEQIRNRQQKRIIYQAEKMREQGNLDNALILYKKAWSLSPNPDIANNLAAILIQSKQYEKAEGYLEQVISLVPDDEDLRFNLEIAREGRKRKKLLSEE